MKNSVRYGMLLLFSTSAFAGPCISGSLLDYINLGGTGCTASSVLLSNFEIVAGQSFATPIAPASVQVTPVGGQTAPALLLTLNTTAAAGELFELFVRYNVGGGLVAASISLGSAVVNGDGAITGILDICAGGSFNSGSPTGCSGTAVSTATFAIEGDSLLSSSTPLPASSFFDVFADITVDGGPSGSASLESATVAVATPEPSTLLLVTAVLGGMAIVRSRRGRRS